MSSMVNPNSMFHHDRCPQGPRRTEELEAVLGIADGSKAKVLALLGVVLTVSITVAGCFGSTPNEVTLDGAGATFPAPLYDVWQGTYSAQVDENTHINYGGGGSGAGITQITARQVDWAGSDAPMNAGEFAAAPGILHVPSTLGAVIPIYNIPGVGDGLNFTGENLARIFNGTLTSWDDPELVANNPGLAGVSQSIHVVHRSDGSGTTFVFTSYLYKVAPTDWPTPGHKSWPNTIGQGQPGNAGVSSGVQQTDYSIGYVELSYASSAGSSLNYGHVESHDGVFLAASAASTAAAAAGLATLPAGDASWEGVEILDQQGANAYPIASMTYILVYRTQDDRAKGLALVNFLWWAIHDGQSYCEANGYAPLPASVVTHNEATINSIVDSSGSRLHG